MDFQTRARELLDEWELYRKARPREHVLSIQFDKDQMSTWAVHLRRAMMWGSANEVAEACHQFEQRLTQFKDNIVIELLTNGSV